MSTQFHQSEYNSVDDSIRLLYASTAQPKPLLNSEKPATEPRSTQKIPNLLEIHRIQR